jgi:hypothetical protein
MSGHTASDKTPDPLILLPIGLRLSTIQGNAFPLKPFKGTQGFLAPP